MPTSNPDITVLTDALRLSGGDRCAANGTSCCATLAARPSDIDATSRNKPDGAMPAGVSAMN